MSNWCLVEHEFPGSESEFFSNREGVDGQASKADKMPSRME